MSQPTHNHHELGYVGLLLSAAGWLANQLHDIDTVVTITSHIIGLIAVIGGAALTWHSVWQKFFNKK